MYTIVMDDRKNLVQTVRTKLCQHDKLVDKMQFLIPNTYDGMDLTGFTVVLKYVDQGNVAHSELLRGDGTADIDDYTRYILPVTSELTRFEGDIEIRITLTKNDYELGTQYVLNTKTTVIHIFPVFEDFNIDVNGTKTYFMTYADIIEALEANLLSVHDVIFTTDTYECYVIDVNLVPRKISAQTAVFESVEEAERYLNNSSLTYVGEIVAIRSGDVYQIYVVNFDEDTNTWFVSCSDGISEQEARELIDEALDGLAAVAWSGAAIDVSYAGDVEHANVQSKIDSIAEDVFDLQEKQEGASRYQGTVLRNVEISVLTDYMTGWYWLVAAPGIFVGERCEIGDMIICIQDCAGAYNENDFSVVQNNSTALTNSEIESIFAE